MHKLKKQQSIAEKDRLNMFLSDTLVVANPLSENSHNTVYWEGKITICNHHS